VRSQEWQKREASVQLKNSSSILGRCRDQIVGRDPAHLGHSLGDVPHECGLIPPTPVRNRCEVWPIRLHQQTVEWRLADGLVVRPVLESHHSTKRHIVAVNQPRSQEGHTAAERVQDNSNVGMVIQDGRHIVVRFTRVNDGRLSSFGGNGELRFKCETLDRSRRVIVVVVESGLPNCNDARVTDGTAEPFRSCCIPVAGLMRMHPGGHYQTRLASRELERSLGGGARLPNHHHPRHTGSPGPLQDGGSVSLVRLIGEVTMCVDQQRRQSTYLPRCPLA
jgi:hypothetical protein